MCQYSTKKCVLIIVLRIKIKGVNVCLSLFQSSGNLNFDEESVPRALDDFVWLHGAIGKSYKIKSTRNASSKIDDFRVAFRLCFKVSPSAKPFIWKLVLFSCK